MEKPFFTRHPKFTSWFREGGFFILISMGITFLKYLMLLKLPDVFGDLRNVGWGWPAIPASLFGKSFTFNIIGYAAEDGGLAYMLANLISSLSMECINFPLQRNITFRSKGPLRLQIPLYFAGWCAVFFLVNAINSIWVGVAVAFVPPTVYNIGTTFLTGGIAMAVFFGINKVIFAPGFGEKKQRG